jgi:hypothetical protein
MFNTAHGRKQERLNQTAESFDRVVEAEQRWFERRPDRSYRLKRASPVEREQRAILSNGAPVPAGADLYTFTMRIDHGRFVRAIVALPETIGEDLDEAACELISAQLLQDLGW